MSQSGQQDPTQQSQRRRQMFLLALFAVGVLILGQSGFLGEGGFLGDGFGSSESRDTRYQQYRDSTDLQRLFDGARYDLDDVRSGGEVPRVLVDRFPSDWDGLGEAERHRLFVAILLPQLLSVNRQLEDLRARLATSADAADAAVLTDKERALVQEVGAALPGLALPADPVAAAQLLADRIGPLPVSLTLAQAARDSAWGTAAAARRDNRLFADMEDGGLVPGPPAGPFASPYAQAGAPLADGARANLRDDLMVRALTLAVAERHAGFRAARSAMEAEHAPLRGAALAAAMGEAPAQIAALDALIAARGMAPFDAAGLAKRPTLVLFARPGGADRDGAGQPDG